LGFVRDADKMYWEPTVAWRVNEETIGPLSQPSLIGTVLAEDRNVHVWVV